jgi:ChrB-like protein
MQLNRWLLLIYKIPREPTASRVSIWRKLKQLGALLLHDSVWVLPETTQTSEQFQWLASEIVELGGEATVWKSELSDQRQQSELTNSFTTKVDGVYKEILNQLRRKNSDLPALARRYQLAITQDFFRSKLGDEVRKALLAKGERKP